MTAEDLFQQFHQNPHVDTLHALSQAYPHHAYTAFAQGYLYFLQRQWSSAITAFHQVLTRNPHLWEARYYLAEALQQQGQSTEAALHYETLIQQRPDLRQVWKKLIPLWQWLHEPRRLQESIRFLTSASGQQLWPEDPDYPFWCSQLEALSLFLHFCEGSLSMSQLIQRAQAWFKRYGHCFDPSQASLPTQPDTRHKPATSPSATGLRIGYVSHEWPYATLSLGYEKLFAYHAQQQKHTLYAIGGPPLPRNLQPYFAAQYGLESNPALDIIVDLSGWLYLQGWQWMQHYPHVPKILLGSNPPFFSPGKHFDRILSDPYVLPKSCRRELSTLVIDMPVFFRWQPGAKLPQSLPDAQSNMQQYKVFWHTRSNTDGFKIGVAASPNKITPDTLRLWAMTLRALPASTRLTFKGEYYQDPLLRQKYRQAYAEVGGRPEQLHFEDNRQRSDFYSFFLEQDLILDSTPYNGALSTCDAYWAGTPVVALKGSRGIAHSLRQNTNTLHLLTQTPEAFIQKVRDYHHHPETLTRDSQALPAALWHSEICQWQHFGQSLETLYETLHQEFSTKRHKKIAE